MVSLNTSEVKDRDYGPLVAPGKYIPPPVATILHLCPEKPSEIGLTIPGDAWWEGQRESVALILHAFFVGVRYVMAGIPTGGGKTLIAAAVQNVLANQSGAFGGKSLALTYTKHLQGQYVKTLNTAALITGRSNHLCDLPPEHQAKITEGLGEPLTAADAPCAAGGTCDIGMNVRDGCDYYSQWWSAADAPMVVMNYAYAARIIPIPKFIERTAQVEGIEEKRTIPNPFRRALLVMDECHLAHDVLVDAAGRKIWISALRECGVIIPSDVTKVNVTEGGPRSQHTKAYENVEVWVAWAKTARERVRARIEELTIAADSQRRVAIEATSSERNHRIREFGGTKRLLTSLKSTEEALTVISYIDDPDEWIIRRDFGSRNQVVSVTAQPLWGWHVIPQMMLQHFGRTLLMSATPGDPEVTRVMLGIKAEEFTYIERPSTFPITNRPVFYYPVAKLNYKSDEYTWSKVAEAIVKIASSDTNLQRKGLVHSGSAANAKRLVAGINSLCGWNRAFTHGAAEDEYSREEALEEFTKSPSPRILVSASFTTGLDLPYIIGWQVIAKVPYGNLGDEITSRRRAFKLANGLSFGQTYYESACMNTVVQAAGRIVRSPTDSGPTFIVDANYAMLHARAFKPAFFSEAFRRIAKGGADA